jgi:hypothetical protein
LIKKDENKRSFVAVELKTNKRLMRLNVVMSIKLTASK